MRTRLLSVPRRAWTVALVAVSALAVAAGLGAPQTLPADELDALYDTPLPPPPAPLAVFHLGHSLVGRDMPAMLAQLAGEGHRYDSQLGWGTPLRAHWEPGVEILGFDTENAHPRFRPAREAVDSGGYDAVVLTELVEIRDAIRHHDSPRYLRLWAEAAQKANPETRVYLYETWHRLDDPKGWLTRLDTDLGRNWEGALLAGAMQDGPPRPIHVIPAGQVFARFVRAAEAGQGGPSVTSREDLFARTDDGALDTIHPNDLGNYLVALTHYAVLYQRSPVGLPFDLLRADGSSATAPDAATARLMQETVWQVVTTYPKTGVPQESDT